MQRLSYPTETVLSNKITRNGIVLQRQSQKTIKTASSNLKQERGRGNWRLEDVERGKEGGGANGFNFRYETTAISADGKRNSDISLRLDLPLTSASDPHLK